MTEALAPAPQPPVIAAPLKPLMRGWSHVLGFVTLAALGTVLVSVTETTLHQRRWLLVYVMGTLAMFGVSSLYHRIRWRPRAHDVMRRLDHSTIYLAIAGAYTPTAIVALAGWHRPAVLGSVWGGTALGLLLQWLPVRVPRVLFTSLYVVVGWSAALALPQLFDGLGAVGFGLLLGGGVLYTMGAVVYALKRPDPWPRVFGFHEVFHACTIAGAGLHLAAIAFAVAPRMG
jgi:hemolysin III